MRHRSTVLAVLVVTAALVAPAVAGPVAATQESCSFPVSRTDATGTEVTVREEPERVVTLAPSAAQTMWEIGAEGKVVGLTQYARYLEGAGSRANVSGAGDSFVSVEKVVNASPDLVLAPNVVSNDTVRKLRESGLTVYRFGFAASLSDVVEKTRLTGRLTGECEAANRRADRMAERLDTVRAAVSGQDRPRVLYVFFGFTAGEGTFIHEVITTAGGTNVAAQANITGYKQISEEVVVEADPQWIVHPSGSPVPRTEAYNSTTAVEEGQVLTVDRNYVSQPAPRIVRPVVKLAKAFHPDAYAAANATATPTPDTTTAPPTTTAPGTTTSAEPTDATAPGFGAALAVLSLLGAAALVGRS